MKPSFREISTTRRIGQILVTSIFSFGFLSIICSSFTLALFVVLLVMAYFCFVVFMATWWFCYMFRNHTGGIFQNKSDGPPLH
jgi:hypothetical protein